VQQYQRYFSDADRVLILLHRPGSDAMASGLAVRNLLRRTKTTAIIAPSRGSPGRRTCAWPTCSTSMSRPSCRGPQTFDRIALVDVQPHYFSGVVDRVDLVIDHHPETTGWSAMFKDIRRTTGPPARFSPSTCAPST